MADDAKTGTEGTQDPITNLKGEFNRKIDGLNSQVSSLAEINKQLLSKLDGLTKPVITPDSTSTDEAADLFERPKQFIQKLKREMSQELDNKIQTVQQAAAQQTQVVGNLYEQYPELNSPNADLTKKANEILKGMTTEEQRNPKFLRVAVLEAAAELGVQPKKRREQDDSSDVAFNAGGRYWNQSETMPKRLKEAESSMLELAEKMGVKGLDKKETQDRLKSRLKKLSR